VKPSIRVFLRAELEKLTHSRARRPLFSPDEIRAEIARRDELLDKRKDRLHYPELQPSFR
jgi:hypothetical protein